MAKTPPIDVGYYKKSQSQYVAFGDVNHGETGFRQSVYSEKNVQALSAAGFKHIAIEMPAYMQPLADKLAAGEITADKFCNQLKEGFSFSFGNDQNEARMLARFIGTAAKNGMRVTFADVQQDSPHASLHGLDDVFEKHARIWGRDHGVNVSSIVRKMRAAKTPAEQTAAFDGQPELRQYFRDQAMKPDSLLERDVMSSRRAGDAKVGAYISGRAHGDKTAIVYGSQHMNYESGGILGNLGAPSVAVMDNRTGRFIEAEADRGGIGGFFSDIGTAVSNVFRGITDIFSSGGSSTETVPQSTVAPSRAVSPNRSALRSGPKNTGKAKGPTHVKKNHKTAGRLKAIHATGTAGHGQHRHRPVAAPHSEI